MRVARLFVSISAACALIIFCAGCGIAPSSTPPETSSAATKTAFTGKAHGGQQPISNASIFLYEVGTDGDGSASTNLLNTTVSTDTYGMFSIPAGAYQCPSSTTLVYIVASGGNPGLAQGTYNAAIILAAALGQCGTLSSSTFISIDEVTTVAAVSALAPFMASYDYVGSTASDAATLANRFTLAAQLASYAAGTAPGSNIPSGMVAPVTTINTLANVLASCVNTAGGASGDHSMCGNLFALSGGTATTDTIAATLVIANNPTSNASDLFSLAIAQPPFLPELSSAPTSWSIVLQTVPVITWPTPSNITYGTALSATQLDATTPTSGTFAYSPASGAVLTAGTQTLSTTFTPTDAVDYSSATQSVTLQVNQAVPALSWSSIAAINYGTALSSTQLDATSSVPGAFVYNPPSGTILTAGTQPLTVNFTPTDTADYISDSLNNTVVVNNSGPSYSWNNVQIIGGGFVTGLVAHPAQQNLFYARTDVGGAYRWNQSAGQWVPLLDWISRSNSSLDGCESIGLDPSDPNRLYLAVGEYAESFGADGEFLLSDNQGATFTQVAAPFKMGSNDEGRFAGERWAVDPNLGTTMYYGSRLNGLYVSTNRGTSWSQVSSFPVTSATMTSGIGIVFIDFVAASGSSGTATPVIYVGVSDTGTSSTGYSSLYRSVNAGATWTVVPGQPTGYYPNHGVFGPDGNLYLSYGNGTGPAGITGGVLYQYALPPVTSPSGNGTWTNITPASPVRPSYSQGGFGTIAADPERPGVLMATTIDDYYPGDDIYRSQNYGATWVSLNQQGKTQNFSASPWVAFGSSTAGTGNWSASLFIDPYNSNHVEYGNGQTVWNSTNINVSDADSGPTFSIGALGIEETVSQILISPPSGSNLISGVGDLGGFVHTSLTATPSSGMIENPRFGSITGLDFAQSVPADIVAVGSEGSGTQMGAYSTNGGTSWTPFAANAPGTTNGEGSAAISANGATILWAPSDTTSIYYTTNNGTSWTAATGATGEGTVLADRISSTTFYNYIANSGVLQISTNSGVSFTNVGTEATYAQLKVSPAAQGDLWLATGSGLKHSTNGGATFSSIGGGITAAYAVGFGAADTQASDTYPAIYLVGNGSSGYGFYRSVDEGATWFLMNGSANQYGYVSYIIGDPRVFGRVYLTTGGRGIIYGSSAY
jgi:hypothetical protein